MWKQIIAVLFLCLCLFTGAAFLLSGCQAVSDTEEAVSAVALDFTVCEESRLPKELLEIIEEKKAAPFKLTFSTREYMYIVVGYGPQKRGNCCVTVNELCRTEDAVYIDTNLIGADLGEDRFLGITYPYVAVKCENQNLPVLYQAFENSY